MAYITKKDIEDVYGKSNIAAWSNLDNDDAQANEARIDKAIVNGQAYIDDKLRGGQWAIPITGTIPVRVIDMAAKIAGVWLYDTRRIFRKSDDNTGLIIQGHQDQVDSWLNQYESGERTLDAPRSHDKATAPQVVT